MIGSLRSVLLFAAFAAAAGCQTTTAPTLGTANEGVLSCAQDSDCPTTSCYISICGTGGATNHKCIVNGIIGCCATAADCDDGNTCTADTCTAGLCSNGNASLDGGVGAHCCTVAATDCAAAGTCQNAASCTNSSCTYTAQNQPTCCNGPADCGATATDFTCGANVCGCTDGAKKFCQRTSGTGRGAGTCAACCGNADCTALPTPSACFTAACGAGTCSYPQKAGSQVCGSTCCLAINGTCNAGTCTLNCTAGFADCDGDPSNGCETNLGTANKKLCGSVCVAAASCCSVADCNSPPSPAACFNAACTGVGGSCNYPQKVGSQVCGGTCCLPTNGTCNAGTCTLNCAAGFGDCDGDPSNGCETDLTATNKKVCGAACIAAASCCTSADCTTPPTPTACYNAGVCSGAGGTCSYTQKGGSQICGGTCCLPINGSCNAGSCTLNCSGGFGDCDGNPTNGCEVATTTITNCGGCAKACDTINSVGASCVAGGCHYTGCTANHMDCNSTAPDLNGCETNLASVNSCGGCGNVCDTVNSTGASCDGTTCKYTGCVAGRADCLSGAPDVNGCETDITTTTDCGGCGRGCSSTATLVLSCTGGVCSSTCQTNFGNCKQPAAPTADDGCETATNSDINNCGGCNLPCPAPLNACQRATCGSSTCGYQSTGGAGCCSVASTQGDCKPNVCQTAVCTDNRCVFTVKGTVAGCCATVDDCPKSANPCLQPTCVANTCGTGPASCDGGTPVDLSTEDLSHADLSTEDLSKADLSAEPPDLSAVPDLSTRRDLAAAPDLSAGVDQAGALSLTGGACSFGGDRAAPSSAWWSLAAFALLLALRRRNQKIG